MQTMSLVVDKFHEDIFKYTKSVIIEFLVRRLSYEI